jgi:PST family polysaccharide transporter
MKEKINKTMNLISNNKKVIENYFFMTVLQILNSMFYFLIYPFLIRTLGAESYGLYVYALSIVTYFISFVGFGFDMPGVKAIAENSGNTKSISNIISCIFTAKIYLEIISFVIFSVVIFSIPYLRNKSLLFYILFFQTFTNIFFPQWYFQGVQRMRVVTIIQLSLKLISLPFIFLLIKSSKDINVFAIITTFSSIGGGIVAAIVLKYEEGIIISWVSINDLKIWFKDSLPFFLSSSTGVIKEQSVTVIIGAFFGMHDVAIYDLANKIIMVPRVFLFSVNGAIFPKVIANMKIEITRKIIKYETLIGITIIMLILVLGKWIVLILGGSDMLASYPISVTLSLTILSWIVVGAYIAFIFVPNSKYFYVAKNQFVALISFVIFCTLGMFIYQNILVLAIAMSLSGLTEIIYCRYVIFKEKLLQ